MAHEVETLMYSGATPWHGLGTFVGDTPVNSAEAIHAAGLDWTVVKCDLRAVVPAMLAQAPAVAGPSPVGAQQTAIVRDPFRGNVPAVGAPSNVVAGPWGTLPAAPPSPAVVGPRVVDVDSHVAIVRDSDAAILGIVGERYKPVQNADAFAFLDSLAADGAVRYEVAGSLRGGRRVFMLAKIGDAEILPGDKIGQYLFLINSHDGTGALRCLFTTIRVVCMNTARAALTAGKGEGISLRHTAGIEARLATAHKILGIAKREHDETAELYRRLTGLRLTAAEWGEFSNIVIPDTDTKSNARSERERRRLAAAYVDGRGNRQFPAMRGTGWAALNASTEWATWGAPKRGDDAQARRFEDAVSGPGADAVSRGLEYLTARLPVAV